MVQTSTRTSGAIHEATVLCIACHFAPPAASGTTVRVLHARDQDEALRIARESEIDLVLLDMPHREPLDSLLNACRSLAADLALATTPILLLHERQLSDDQLAAAYEAGAAKIISSSSSSRLISAAVGACLRVSIARRTADRNRQKEVSHSIATLETLMETIPIGITIADADGRTQTMSRFGAELLGWPRDQLTGVPVAEYASHWTLRRPGASEPAASEDLPLFRAITRGEQIIGEEWLLRAADGREILLLSNAAPMRDEAGAITGGILVWADFTERKRHEVALREMEERFRTLLETIPDVAYRRDLRTETYDYIGPEIERIMGITAGELRNIPTERVLDRIHPDDRPHVLQAIEEEKRSGRARAEYRFRTASGEYRWMADHFSVQKDADGQPLYRVGIVRDTTERKRIEEELRDSRAFLSRITDIVPSILYVYDMVEGRNVWGNRELFTSLGYQPEQVAALGPELLSTIMHPEDWATYESHRQRVFQLRDDELAEIEYRIRSADGSWRWFYSREMPFRRSADGAVAQIVGVAIDITARRQAEQLLRDSESRYRTLFEANPLPMWLIDLDSLRFLAVNDAAIAHYGYSREEFLAMSITDIRPPEDVPRTIDAASTLEPGRRRHGLWRHRRKNGAIIDVEIASHVLEVQGQRTALILAHDVTERLRAERELRESENRFRLALAAAPIVVFEQDRDLRYTWINNPAPDFRPESVIGRTDDEILGPAGAELTRLKRSVLESGRGIRREVALQLASGRRDYDLVIEPLARNGHIAGIACAAIDITDRVRAARDMERANQELQRFTSIASHDLKEPLRGVALLSRFMLEDEKALSSEGRKHLKRIGTLCDRLIEMINGLLEYARSGGAHRNEPCDLAQIARAAADKVAETVGSEGVELTISDQLPTIPGDPVLLERVFANLIGNAVKHNRAPLKRIWIGAEGDAVFVHDNGPGIEPRHHDRIFDLFTRLPGGASSEGIGLGLALVKNIVESHGGRVQLRSSPGEGATFLMHFPGAVFPARRT